MKNMNVSHKILLLTAVFLFSMLIAFLLVLRRDMKTLLTENKLLNYSEIQVGKFDNLIFSSNWKVTIRQGKKYRLEIATNSGENPITGIENKNGSLHLTVEETPEKRHAEQVHAKITAPVLQLIKAEGNTTIEMKTFWSDSLLVILKDSAMYAGKDLDYGRIRFQSSSDVR